MGAESLGGRKPDPREQDRVNPIWLWRYYTIGTCAVHQVPALMGSYKHAVHSLLTPPAICHLHGDHTREKDHRDALSSFGQGERRCTRCLSDEDAKKRSGSFAPIIPAEDRSAPAETCHCGYYGLFAPDGEAYVGYLPVVVLAVGGHGVAYTRGMRVQQVRLIAAILDDAWLQTINRMHAVLDAIGLPAYHGAEAAHWLSEHGLETSHRAIFGSTPARR